MTAGDIERVSGLDVADVVAAVAGLHLDLDKFLQAVVRHRKEKAIHGWKAWILEDPLVHPYRLLRTDLVPPTLSFLAV